MKLYEVILLFDTPVREEVITHNLRQLGVKAVSCRETHAGLQFKGIATAPLIEHLKKSPDVIIIQRPLNIVESNISDNSPTTEIEEPKYDIIPFNKPIETTEPAPETAGPVQDEKAAEEVSKSVKKKPKRIAKSKKTDRQKIDKQKKKQQKSDRKKNRKK